MIQNPSEGLISVVEKESSSIAKNYICVFNDETTNALKIRRYHENVPGDTSVDGLYQLVSLRSNYKYGTFMLAYLVNNEEVLIDYGCHDTLAELLKDENQKQFFLKFSIKQKDGCDPVNVIVDSIDVIGQDSSESHDVEAYAGSFFKQVDENEEQTPSSSSRSYAMGSSTSYTNYDVTSTSTVKSNTGFVGLVNQAMTCYLNSLLQTLFMTPEFRNALYRWRFKGTSADAARSIPYQLQKLFLKLETSTKRAVETTNLTKSFGWDGSEAWQQHDVQELCRVMFDALEETLKDTDQANLINQLYQGEMKDYVKCLKCGHENSRQDNYLDISVDVRPFGSKESHETLEDALKAFITPETLEGNNQYSCEKCNSKQDAHKGLKFVSFPYLLTIQLKRFTFDFNTLQRIKLHDRLTFPYELDLNDYIAHDEEKASVSLNGCACPADEKVGESSNNTNSSSNSNNRRSNNNNAKNGNRDIISNNNDSNNNDSNINCNTMVTTNTNNNNNDNNNNDNVRNNNNDSNNNVNNNNNYNEDNNNNSQNSNDNDYCSNYINNNNSNNNIINSNNRNNNNASSNNNDTSHNNRNNDNNGNSNNKEYTKANEDDEDKDTDETLEGASASSSTEHSTGPYRYELFSVLIHSGSAIGGHYYAYIKCFDDGRWYCFNDQYVSQVSEEDVEKSHGGIDKDRGGYYSSNYSSSTNAYMLMYRRVDSGCNKRFVKKSSWTSSLTDLCEQHIKDEQDEHSRIQREKDVCNVRVYCLHPTTNVKMDGKLAIHKDKTLHEATEMAWEHFKLSSLMPLEQCRLIKYDDYNEAYDRSFSESDNTPMSRILGGVRVNYGFDLLLELRKEEEQFKVYSPGGTTLKVHVISLQDDEFPQPRIVHVPLSLTVEQLKEVLEEYTGVSGDNVRIVMYKEYHGFNLLTNPTRTLKLEGFYKNTKVFVEGDDAEDAAKEFKESKFYERLEVFNNTISMHITLPFDDETAPGGKKEMVLNIDKRITLNGLKDKIAQHADLDRDNFRVYRVYSNNQEFECVKGEEQLTSYLDDTKIVVKAGRALKDGEWRIKVFYLHVKEADHMEFLVEAIIGIGMSVRMLKEEQIQQAFHKKLGKEIPLERIRIRKKSYRNPCRVYPDACVFDKDINVGYTTELFAEILEEEEQVKCDDDLSLYVRRWSPSTYTLGNFDEVVLHKDTTNANLKKELEKISSIPAGRIHIGKGRGVFPCMTSLLEMENEIDWNPMCLKLAEFPLSISDDGAVIYYKSCDEGVKLLSESEKVEIRKKEQDKSSSSGGHHTNRPNYRKEKALKIYTNGVKR